MENDQQIIFELAGFISGFLNAISLIPQLLKTMRNAESIRGLSSMFLTLDLLSGIFTLIYGVGIYVNEPTYAIPVLVTTPIGVICSGMLLIIKARSEYVDQVRYIMNRPLVEMKN